ncbi:peptidoglycan-binding protein [Patescibacteria group bacterium]|nr:peptidoglycan-binding protein [Patescibacteria group bacterium]
MINITKFYGISGWAKNLVSSLTILALLITSAGALLAFPQNAQAATLFSDGFETGNFSQWSAADNDWDIINDTHGGSSAAEVKDANGDELRKNISTVGSQNIVLSYWYKIPGGLSADDELEVQWSSNGGSTWTTIVNYDDSPTQSNWLQASHSLPSGANNNANFRIRFYGSSLSSSDKFRLDDVLLTGDAMPGTIVVNKTVTNNSGGTATASNFSFKVNNGSPIQFEADGSNSLSVAPGTYTITEVTPVGYAVSYSPNTSNSCVLTVTAGGTSTCTITNNDDPVPATISATKIVCDSEADLPNMSGGANITASTASTFLSTHPNCRLQSGWNFEWAPSAAANPGDNVGAAGGSWTPFPATNGSGVATAQVPAGSSVWVREQMQANYVPFTGVSGGNVSAEIYCSSDVENYDNYDSISSPAFATTYHCVAFNALPAPKLTVVKTVTNDNGGTLGVGDFPLFIDGNPTTSGTPATVSIGAHTVSETNVAGYAATFGGDCAANGTVTLSAGQNKTCTIVNNDIAPTLSVTKTVTNDNGGVKVIADFILKIASSIVTSGVANTLNAGTYTVSEEAAAGYTGTIGGDCASNGTITLAIGENKNCTIVNDDNTSSLTLNKVVIDDNDNNGTTPASAFTLTATGATGFSGVGPSVNSSGVVSFDAGDYNLSESGPAGYAASAWVCTGGTQVDADTVTVGLGQNVICTITNNDIPLPACSNGTDDDGDGLTDSADPGCHTDLQANNPDSYNANATSEGNESTLATCSDGQDNDGDTFVDLNDSGCSGYIPKVIVHKTVINDNLGGTKGPADFTFDLSYTTNSGTTSFLDTAFTPISSGTGQNTIFVLPGTFTVTEDPVQGYTATMTGACSGSIAIGETKQCYFANNDQATTVLVKKVLVNDNGKTNATSTFSFKLNNTGSSYFFDTVGEVLLSILPGSYSVLEDSSTNAGYTVTHSESCSGSLLLGQTATCTITNNDKPACADGIENDVPSDGLIDQNDPGCFVDNGDGGTVYDPNGQSEGNETTLAMCTDESDNDGDNLIDLADPDCAPFKPVLIVKKVLSYDGEIPPTFFNQFSFSLNGGEAQNFDSEDGMNTLTLNTEGTHTIVETGIPSNWDFGSVSCLYDGQSAGESITNGHQILVDAGDVVTCTFTNVWNPDFDCSDGLDNDGDGLSDAGDPGCHLDNDPNNPNSYSPTSLTEVNNPGNGGGGGGGSGGADPQLFSNGSNGPFVLGASIGPSNTDGAGGVLGETCGLYMDKFLKRAWSKNDLEQVKKLQAFLNKWVGANLPITGFFGPMTEEAVKAFQASNPDSILKPWNLTSATGLVYITTLRQMNLIECPALSLELPTLVPWTDN